MKALVYHGAGKCAWEDKPRRTIQDPGDAIVRITTSTICGTDLHILKGDLPAVTDGRVFAHEGIGIIEEGGSDVSDFHVGTRSSSLASRPASGATFANEACTLTAGMAAGF